MQKPSFSQIWKKFEDCIKSENTSKQLPELASQFPTEFRSFVLINWGIDNVLKKKKVQIEMQWQQCKFDNALRDLQDILEKKEEVIHQVAEALAVYPRTEVFIFCNQFFKSNQNSKLFKGEVALNQILKEYVTSLLALIPCDSNHIHEIHSNKELNSSIKMKDHGVASLRFASQETDNPRQLEYFQIVQKGFSDYMVESAKEFESRFEHHIKSLQQEKIEVNSNYSRHIWDITSIQTFFALGMIQEPLDVELLWRDRNDIPIVKLHRYQAMGMDRPHEIIINDVVDISGLCTILETFCDFLKQDNLFPKPFALTEDIYKNLEDVLRAKEFISVITFKALQDLFCKHLGLNEIIFLKLKNKLLADVGLFNQPLTAINENEIVLMPQLLLATHLPTYCMSLFDTAQDRSQRAKFFEHHVANEFSKFGFEIYRNVRFLDSAGKTMPELDIIFFDDHNLYIVECKQSLKFNSMANYAITFYKNELITADRQLLDARDSLEKLQNWKFCYDKDKTLEIAKDKHIHLISVSNLMGSNLSDVIIRLSLAEIRMHSSSHYVEALSIWQKRSTSNNTLEVGRYIDLLQSDTDMKSRFGHLVAKSHLQSLS